MSRVEIEDHSVHLVFSCEIRGRLVHWEKGGKQGLIAVLKRVTSFGITFQGRGNQGLVGKKGWQEPEGPLGVGASSWVLVTICIARCLCTRDGLTFTQISPFPGPVGLGLEDRTDNPHREGSRAWARMKFYLRQEDGLSVQNWRAACFLCC